MPELPEVETTLRGIQPHLLHQQVARVVVRDPRLRWPVPTDVAKAQGQRFVSNPKAMAGVVGIVYSAISTHLTRFHGFFAPNSKYRAKVTPARRRQRKKYHSADIDQTSAEKRVSMTWAKRLKRVFNIDKVN